MEVPDYELPEAAIAQVPAEPRDSARLLDAISGTVRHRHVRDLPALVAEGDVLVLNTSRVVPARLRLQKQTGGRSEVLLIGPLGAESWEAMVRPGRRLPPGTVLHKGQLPIVEVCEHLPNGNRRVRSLVSDLLSYGELALPPYIREPLDDPERYQTVYSDQPGSVAAPTAGLHLTERVLDECRGRGASVVALDLAVGPGTFKPVKVARAEDHEMHPERYVVPEATWEACKRAKQAGGRVWAVGTTSVRALESVAATGSLQGATKLYIRPGHHFSVVDVLMTNFHQPKSTLLLLLEAFVGPRWRELYAVALKEGYRFLSFGDAMVVGRA